MPRRSASRPLEGKVSIVGVRPQVSLTDRRAKVADLSITLSGGSGSTPVPITFSISLNVPVSGGAQLTDGAGTVLAESTRSATADQWIFGLGSGAVRSRRLAIASLNLLTGVIAEHHGA